MSWRSSISSFLTNRARVVTQTVRQVIANVSLQAQLKLANVWRDTFNPLRGLTISRAVCLLEAGERGDQGDLQWTYRFIEKRYPVLCALLARYDSGIGKIDPCWKATPEDDLPPGATEAMAEAQRVALRTAYEQITNLTQALRHLTSARFRGFAHCQILRDESGDIFALEPIPQWHMVRDGTVGKWRYSPTASGSFAGGKDISDREILSREVERPVNEIALINFVRASMSEKDWDGYIEVFGIPAIFIALPPNIPTGKEAEYQDTAEGIVSDARGVLPNGADVKTVTAEKGTNPFKERVTHLDEQVVLAGTGGKLTMLTESGSGTLAGGAHSDTWDDIIEGEAVEIRAVLWELDEIILSKKFPDQPILAYTELVEEEEEDTKQLADTVAVFHNAGFDADAEELTERTGLKLTKALPAPAPQFGGFGGGFPQGRADLPVRPNQPPAEQPGNSSAPNSEQAKPLLNRATLEESAAQQLGTARARDLQPVIDRLQRIFAISDPAIFQATLARFRADLPNLLRDINADPAAATVLAEAMNSAFANGLSDPISDSRSAISDPQSPISTP